FRFPERSTRAAPPLLAIAGVVVEKDLDVVQFRDTKIGGRAVAGGKIQLPTAGCHAAFLEGIDLEANWYLKDFTRTSAETRLLTIGFQHGDTVRNLTLP